MKATRLPCHLMALFLVLAQPFVSSERAHAAEPAEPQEVLQAFLKADSVDKLLPLVADRDAIEEEIRAYYKNGVRKAIVAQDVECVSRGLIPGTRLEVCLYMVRAGRNRIPVSVEQTKAGYKVDWKSFTQFHDRSLEKFFDDSESAGGEFLVQLRRSHCFGNDIPDLGELICFRVQSPIAPFLHASVFVRKGSEEAKGMLEQFRWSQDYRPVVEMKWVKPAPGNGAARIELVRVVRSKWRG